MNPLLTIARPTGMSRIAVHIFLLANCLVIKQGQLELGKDDMQMIAVPTSAALNQPIGVCRNAFPSTRPEIWAKKCRYMYLASLSR